MEPDEIMKEVYARKLDLARETNFDFDTLWKRLQELEREHPDRLVRPPHIEVAMPEE